MKKVLSLVVACLFLFSTFTSVFANEVKKEDKVKEYKYKYEGINITTNVEMTDEQQEDLINTITNKPTASFVPSPEDGSILVKGPYRRNYTNTAIKYTADTILFWTIANTPVFNTTIYAAGLFTALAAWNNNNIVPTYVESWITKSWSEYDLMYKYYSTVVHYSSSSYSTILDVQYYETAYATY